MNSIGVRWAGVAVVGLVAMWLLTGCGGHGGGGWTRMLTGVAVVDNFVVAAGERVGARGDVVVQCQTATVDGELISQDSTGAGANGGSITMLAAAHHAVRGGSRARAARPMNR